MRCETCEGVGEVLIDRDCNIVQRVADAVMMIPCPNCGGSGWDYCCDGERAADPEKHPAPE